MHTYTQWTSGPLIHSGHTVVSLSKVPYTKEFLTVSENKINLRQNGQALQLHDIHTT